MHEKKFFIVCLNSIWAHYCKYSLFMIIMYSILGISNTGVTKFSKISIFSDLNNLKDISMHENYAGICGITHTELEKNFQPEIQALAQKQQLDYPHAIAELKQWYDGYLFHPAGEGMYNPFSVLGAFDAKEIKSYWFGTGTPTFLVNYLKETYYNIPDLDGNVQLNEAGLETYRAVAEDALPILFQAGYLTIKDYSKESRMYRLGFPNDEVRYGFLYNLLPAYSSVPFGQTGVSVWRLIIGTAQRHPSRPSLRRSLDFTFKIGTIKRNGCCKNRISRHTPAAP